MCNGMQTRKDTTTKTSKDRKACALAAHFVQPTAPPLKKKLKQNLTRKKNNKKREVMGCNINNKIMGGMILIC